MSAEHIQDEQMKTNNLFMLKGISNEKALTIQSKYNINSIQELAHTTISELQTLRQKAITFCKLVYGSEYKNNTAYENKHNVKNNNHIPYIDNHSWYEMDIRLPLHTRFIQNNIMNNHIHQIPNIKTMLFDFTIYEFICEPGQKIGLICVSEFEYNHKITQYKFVFHPLYIFMFNRSLPKLTLNLNEEEKQQLDYRYQIIANEVQQTNTCIDFFEQYFNYTVNNEHKTSDIHNTNNVQHTNDVQHTSDSHNTSDSHTLNRKAKYIPLPDSPKNL